MADYAISNVPRRVVYAASGTGPYAFTFEILNQTDIAVYKASTLLTLTTDYTVTINANGTGSVTLVLTAGTSNITIVGSKNIQRTTDFTTGGDLFANTLNDELDNQTIFIQQVAETAERGLKAPVTDPTDIAMTLPAKDSRKGKVLAFDSTTGNPVAGPALDAVTTVIAQSANINTVATNIASVNTVAGNTSNINTVAGVSSNVTTVATNIASVNTNATNIVAIQNASTNATNAAASAVAAGNAQTAAEAARDATLTAYDNFDDRYLGAKTSDPTLDNDGNALVAGSLYFNSVSGIMKLYTGSAWVAAYVSGTGLLSAASNLSDLTNTSTARTNLGVAIGTNVQAYSAQLQSYATNGVAMKNRLINGAMVINQRAFSGTAVDAQYCLDRWSMTSTQTSKYTVSQSSTAPTGFNNSLLATSSSAYSVLTGDYFSINQFIEGFNTADLGWGTANAKTVTLSFQVYSSLTGTFGGAIVNNGVSYSYPFSYSIPVANTWTTISITIVGPTAGTWVGATNGVGMRIYFSLGAGASQSGTAGSWASAFYTSATGATSVVGTNGATFYITGVQLEVGSSATGFEYVNYQTSLANCQRYFYKDFPATVSGAFAAGLCYNSTTIFYSYRYPVTMRSAPTLAYSALSDINIILGNNVITPTSITADGLGTSSCRLNIGCTGAAVGNGSIFQGVSSNAFLSFSAEL